MTREEAIKWLSNLKLDIGKTQHQELWHYEQAIDDIIEVLGRKSCVEISENCIDRYSVLAELDPLSYEYKVIKELPSVVPTERTGECCAGCKWEYKWVKECKKCSRAYIDNYERKEE